MHNVKDVFFRRVETSAGSVTTVETLKLQIKVHNKCVFIVIIFIVLITPLSMLEPQHAVLLSQQYYSSEVRFAMYKRGKLFNIYIFHCRVYSVAYSES